MPNQGSSSDQQLRQRVAELISNHGDRLRAGYLYEPGSMRQGGELPFQYRVQEIAHRYNLPYEIPPSITMQTPFGQGWSDRPGPIASTLNNAGLGTLASTIRNDAALPGQAIQGGLAALGNAGHQALAGIGGAANATGQGLASLLPHGNVPSQAPMANVPPTVPQPVPQQPQDMLPLAGNPSIRGYHQGGIVPGKGNDDTVPAMLTPGEMVLSNPQRKYYQEVLDKALKGKMGSKENTKGRTVTKALNKYT